MDWLLDKVIKVMLIALVITATLGIVSFAGAGIYLAQQCLIYGRLCS